MCRALAIHKIFAGFMDQNGPRVRVRKIVMMSGHGQLQIHHWLEVLTVEVKNALGKIKQAKCGDGPR